MLTCVSRFLNEIFHDENITQLPCFCTNYYQHTIPIQKLVELVLRCGRAGRAKDGDRVPHFFLGPWSLAMKNIRATLRPC